MSCSETTYWEARYQLGGDSGKGSTGEIREWKWSIIESFAQEDVKESVVDIGCGDTRFWHGRSSNNYTGIDVSPTVITRNQQHHPQNYRFICYNAQDYIEGLRAQVVLCIDVIYHISTKESVIKILENLCRYSTKWIFIYTLFNKPPTMADHMYYYNLEDYIDIFKDFLLVRKLSYTKLAGMYVFKRR